MKKTDESKKNKGLKNIKMSLMLKYGLCILGLVVALCTTNMINVGNAIIKTVTDRYSASLLTLTNCTASSLSNHMEFLISEMKVYSDSDIAKEGDVVKTVTYLRTHKELKNPEIHLQAFVSEDGRAFL